MILGEDGMRMKENEVNMFLGTKDMIFCDVSGGKANFGIWAYQRPANISKSTLWSGTSSNLQSPKLGLTGHGSSLPLQNQVGETKF